MIESFRDELPLLMIRTGKGDGTLAHCSQSRELVNQKKEVAEERRRPLGGEEDTEGIVYHRDTEDTEFEKMKDLGDRPKDGFRAARVRVE
jgi:hypothetical protein